ncbi:hypothetical protein FRB90_002293 [Tulasnella sp. 427]|nr:hypothetical protein FRB90_002293 [Tulasnella sp. 427]
MADKLILANRPADDPIHVQYMKLALDEARKCEPTPTAFCVGCLIVIPGVEFDIPPGILNEYKDVLSTGYSRELSGNTHAEANALTKALANSETKIGGDRIPVEGLLTLSDVYTTLEPCSVRLSGLAPCADALVKAKIKRCFVGVSEPKDFVECEGQRKLMEAGIEVQASSVFYITATLEDSARELVRATEDLLDLHTPSPSLQPPPKLDKARPTSPSAENEKMKESQDIESATVQLSPVLETMGLPGQPDSKERRYDRQLRLWAASGQSALESAHILVLGASPTATSILKNLVLPGIGAFTILDDGVVEGKDLGANFFLETDSLGKNKAEEAIKFLGELNDSVAAHAQTRSLDSILDDDPTYLHKFSLIIAENVPQRLLERISSILWDPASAGAGDSQTISPPLVVVRTSGFLADFGIQLRELPWKNGRLPKAGDGTDREEMTSWVKDRLTATGWTPDLPPEDSAMTGADEEEEEEALPKEITLWEHVTNAIGEVFRAPAAELPTTAALMGGMVAQEVIKVITKQYIPIDGVCAVDLVSSTTSTVKV